MFLATVILLLSCIEITSSSSTVQIVLSSVRSNTHMMAPLCEQPDYKLVQFQLQKLYGEIVQLQSALNDDYNNVEEKSNMYHISEPIIRRLFPKRVLLCSLSSSFHWFIQLCNETLQHFAGFGAFFVQSCDRFLFRLNFFSHFSRSFLIFFLIVVISF